MLKFRPAYTKEQTLWKTCVNCVNYQLSILNAVFSKAPNGKQLSSFKESDQNMKKNKRYEKLYRNLDHVEGFNQIIHYYYILIRLIN